jgi:hypothetical protein
MQALRCLIGMARFTYRHAVVRLTYGGQLVIWASIKRASDVSEVTLSLV